MGIAPERYTAPVETAVTRHPPAPRAYVLTFHNGYDEPCAVVYAQSARHSRKQFEVIDGATYVSTSSRRAKDLDKYAPQGGPTVTDLVRNHGWHFGCSGCQEMVTIESHPEFVILRDDPTGPYLACGPSCLEKARARHSAFLARVQATLDAALSQQPAA